VEPDDAAKCFKQALIFLERLSQEAEQERLAEEAIKFKEALKSNRLGAWHVNCFCAEPGGLRRPLTSASG
jgi:hypothetical protein